MKADIKGIIASLNITEDNFLIPVYEAVVNSIQSIHEQSKLVSDHKGQIQIIINRDKTQTDLYEGQAEVEGNYPIADITIIDNGIGFNNNNFDSFNTAHSTKKIKIGGKGLGRFSMLSVYGDVKIKSIYNEKKAYFEREIFFSENYDETKDSSVKPLDKPSNTGTTAILSKLQKQFNIQSTQYSQEKIADGILHHCLLYYINEDHPEILVKEDGFGDINLSTQFNPTDFLINQYLNEKIKKETFNFYIIKEEVGGYNFYSYTADNRMVETKKTSTILPVFKSKVENNGKEYYVGVYITSRFLNTRVTSNRLEIKFDRDKKDTQSSFDTITEKEIESKVVEVLGREFADLLKVREDENKAKVSAYLRDEGIGYRWLEIDDNFLRSIPDDADSKKLDDLFHDLEYKTKKNLNRKRDKLLSRDYSNSKEYKDLLNDVLSTIGRENESQLAKYVSHRKVVIDLLQKYLQWQEEQQQYEEESALHNLFFTMGGTEKNIAHSLHNLWLIDERLAYFRFIRSDIAQKNHDLMATDSAKEPDITLYDTSYKYGNIRDDGEIQSVVFIEFKRPHRGDLTYQTYQKQMMEQVKGIESGIENSQGSYMNVSANKTIYFYFVCDVKDFMKIKADAISFGGFSLSPYGTLMKFDKNRVEEIMTYQQVKASAIQRNRSFFKNLGIE